MRTSVVILLLTTVVLCTETPGFASQGRQPRFRKIAPSVVLPTRQTVLQTVAMPTVAIFNGDNLDGWTTVSGSQDIRAWEVVEGTLHRKSGGGDIVTKNEYENFILDFEWKISSGGNSGLKYKFADFDGSWLGCEYQILDDANHGDGALPTHRTASLYDVIAPRQEAAKPVGEYNHSRIIVNGKRVQHWLNGRLIVDVAVGSPTWEKGFQTSKFKDHEQFGKIASGKILLQDHGDEVWFKNLVLRELKTVPVKKVGPLQRLHFSKRFR